MHHFQHSMSMLTIKHAVIVSACNNGDLMASHGLLSQAPTCVGSTRPASFAPCSTHVSNGRNLLAWDYTYSPARIGMLQTVAT